MPEFEILEHTADIGIRVHGVSLEEIFSTAALALQSVSLDDALIEPQAMYVISAQGEDLEALLVNWLNEMVFFLDGKRVGFARIEPTLLNNFEIQATAWGEPLNSQRHPMQLVVKAATYHQLKIIRQETGWTAEIFLDI